MITPLLTASTHSSTPIAPVSNGVGQTPTPPSVLSGENHQTSASDTLPTIPPTTLIPKGEPQVPRSSPQSALADSILQALWLTPFFSLPLFAHLGNMIKNAFSSREQAVGVEAGIAKKPEAVFDELRTSRLVLNLRFALLMAKIKFPKNSKPWAKINSAMDQANELNKAFTKKTISKEETPLRLGEFVRHTLKTLDEIRSTPGLSKVKTEACIKARDACIAVRDLVR